jgi:hypothetical protein
MKKQWNKERKIGAENGQSVTLLADARPAVKKQTGSYF